MLSVNLVIIHLLNQNMSSIGSGTAELLLARPGPHGSSLKPRGEPIPDAWKENGGGSRSLLSQENQPRLRIHKWQKGVEGQGGEETTGACDRVEGQDQGLKDEGGLGLPAADC